MKPRTILIDSNLMTLFIVGLYDRTFIVRHKNTASYSEKDFDKLSTILLRASSIVVTPNIVTETSNLLAQCAEPIRSRLAILLMIAMKPSEHNRFAPERYVDSLKAFANSHYVRLGVADAASLEALDRETEIISSDWNLVSTALSIGLHGLYFLKETDQQ
jgi:hypothetical protein